MAFLYRKGDGREIRTHSYSAGSDFDKCKRLYYLKRVAGWKERDHRASLEFGKTLEAAIEWYHTVGDCRPGATAARFTTLWDSVKNVPNLVYSAKEGSWDDLLQMGQEMCQLYELKLPGLPIIEPQFQLNYNKEVFPDSPLAGIYFTAYIDMLVERSGTNGLVIDIKTSSTVLPEPHSILRLDPQLREYAWVTGIEDVAFLWFVKARPGSLKRGDSITQLDSGEEEVVMSAHGQGIYTLAVAEYDSFELECKNKRGKALEAVKDAWELQARLNHPSEITKQRLQFAQVRIPPADQREAGDQIGQEIRAIVEANEANHWPKRPSVRFPDQKCVYCPMLGLCAGDDALRDKKLIPPPEQEALVLAQHDPLVTTKDWIEELEAA
jgi:hypothetical protein